jgi:hypothetical protein
MAGLSPVLAPLVVLGLAASTAALAVVATVAIVAVAMMQIRTSFAVASIYTILV